MESEFKPLADLAIHFNRSSSTLHKWRAKGASGFIKRSGMVYGDPQAIKEWVDQNQATKPGPKGLSIDKNI